MKRSLLILFFINIAFADDWIVDLNRKYSPAVVTIICYDIFNEQISHGSGFNVDPSGIIVTNEHVISNPSIAKVKVNFQNNEIFEVRGVLYEDNFKDLALLRIDGFDLPVVKLGNSNNVEPGEKVVAIGSPLSTELSGSITDGIISQVREMDGTKYFQMTANINKGNSGGPLFNKKGEVIAVNTLGSSTENLFFSVTINYVRGALPNSKNIIRKFSNENAKVPNTGRVSFVSDLDSVKIILTILDTVDIDYGYLPVEIPPLPTGGYKYLALKPNYGYVEGDFYIAKGRETEEIIKLERNLSKVKFISNVEDVDIFLNGEYYGKTPHTEYLMKGYYKVLAKKDGYDDISENFSLYSPDDKIVNLDYISLEIITDPEDAIVNFNGLYKGGTPLKIDNLQTGYHNIKIKKTGYFTEERRISIDSNNPKPIEINLEKISYLTIEGLDLNEANVDLTNDEGESVKNALGEIRNLELKSGHYKLGIMKYGYDYFQKDIFLGKGDNQVIDVVLEKAKGMITIYRTLNLSGVERLLPEKFSKRTYFKIKPSGKANYKNWKPDKVDGSYNSWELPVGKYQMKIESENYLPYQFDFLITPNGSKELGVLLESIESIEAEIKSLKFRRNISFISSAFLAGAGVYLKSLANTAYQDYLVAGSDADDFRNDVELNDKMSSNAYLFSGVFFIPLLHYHHQIHLLKSQLQQ